MVSKTTANDLQLNVSLSHENVMFYCHRTSLSVDAINLEKDSNELSPFAFCNQRVVVELVSECIVKYN